MIMHLVLGALLLAALAMTALILYRHHRRRGMHMTEANLSPELAASGKRLNSNSGTRAAVLE